MSDAAGADAARNAAADIKIAVLLLLELKVKCIRLRENTHSPMVTDDDDDGDDDDGDCQTRFLRKLFADSCLWKTNKILCFGIGRKDEFIEVRKCEV